MTFFKTACRAAGLMLAAGAILTGGIAARADVDGYAYTNLHDFEETYGPPCSNLLPDGHGGFYGLTNGTETGADSVLFDYTPGTGGAAGVFAVVGDFDDASKLPASNRCGLVTGPDGVVYGTTGVGDGTLFRYDPSTHLATTLYTFTGDGDGSAPRGKLAVDANGNVYGTTTAGGTNGGGTLFQYNVTTQAMTTLYSFDSSGCFGGVTLGPDGNLYGATTSGGTNGVGTLFEYKPTLGTLTTLYSFSYLVGAHPSGQVAVDASGNVYGSTADGGGTDGRGTLFEYSADTGMLTTLYIFNDDGDGAYPDSGVTMDAHGNLFGTTITGGFTGALKPRASGPGTAYEYTPGTSLLTTIYHFTDSNARYSAAPVTLDSKGNIFGVTFKGGANGYGVLFELGTPDPAVSLRYDANGDGREDFLWRNSQTGQLAFWNMDDDTRLSDATFDGSTDPNWTVVGAGNVDTHGTTYLLWQNLKTQQLAVWYMNGATRLSDITFPGSTDSSWVVVSTADFDSDGNPDLLWRNTKTGAVAVWYLGGSTRVERLSDAAVGTVSDLNWRIMGTADFDGDGHPDILWQNSKTTEVGLWHMNNATVIDKPIFATVGDPAWKIVGTGDYDADGKADILWQNMQTAQLSIWHMDDVTRGTTTTFAGSTDPAWTIIGIH